MPSASLWRSAGPLVAGRAASAIIGIALPAVLARSLDQGEYGTYKQVYLVANLALYSLQFGLAQSLFYFVPRAASEEEKREYIGQTQVLLAAIGLVCGVLFWAGSPLIAERFSNPALAELALPIGLLAGALVAGASLEVALTARGRPVLSAVGLVSTDLLRVASMLLPVMLGHGIKGLAWGAALAAVVRWAASSIVVGGTLRISGERLRHQLVYALPYGAAILLAMPQQQLHQIFVAARLSPELFALYAVGCMQIPVVSLLYAPVSETLQVRLASLEHTGETHLAGAAFAEAVDRLALVFLPLCALLIATAEPGLRLLYGEPYLEAAGVLRIAVLSVAVSSLPLDGVLKARARTTTLLVLYAAKLSVTWPLLALGFHLFGMSGAIGAHVLVDALLRAAQVVIVAREVKVQSRVLLGGWALLRSGAVAVLVGLSAFVVAREIESPLLACLVAGGIAAAIVGSELWRRRRVARRELGAVAVRAEKKVA